MDWHVDLPWWGDLLVVLVVLVGSGAGGYFLGRWFRMPDHRGRIGLVLFSLLASLAVVLLKWPPVLGIDLKGGVMLVYDLKPNEEGQPVDMEQMARILAERVDPGNVGDVIVRPRGDRQVEVVAPGADEAELRRLTEILSKQGTLEFRILADRQAPEDEAVIKQADALPPNVSVVRSQGMGPDGTVETIEKARYMPLHAKAEESYRNNSKFCVRNNARGEEEILVLTDPFNVTGDYLTRAYESVDERGRRCISFSFNSEGAERFKGLTGANLPRTSGGIPFDRYLGILLDGELRSAPTIRERIIDQGQITGDFTREEVESQVDVLNSGSLPASLNKTPSTSRFIGPNLGEDQIRRGAISMAISLVLVFVFSVFYYRFAGFVAALAMGLNVLLLLACMILIRAAFTLPGLAGMALTVGMAIDANVLIYERLREEIDRNTTLRMAIRYSFARAWSTILDSNLTTLISAVVLYAVGTDQVRGFAITLFIGVVVSMFTAVFCARVVFDVSEKMRWIKKLSMLRMMTTTNWDFLGKRWICIAGSVVLIVLGVVAVGVRGSNIFDIDFTGGSQVELFFREPQRIADIRGTVEPVLPDVAVSNVAPYEGELAGRRFLVSTSNLNIDEGQSVAGGPALGPSVKDVLIEKFGDRLMTNQVNYAPARLEAPAPPSGTPSAFGPAILDPAQTSPPPPAGESPPAPSADSTQPPNAPSSGCETALQPADASQPATGQPSDVPPPPPPGETSTASQDPPAPPAPSPSPKARYELTFPVVKMHYELLEKDLSNYLASVERPNLTFEISHPEYEKDKAESFKNWFVEFHTDPQEAETILKGFEAQVEAKPVFPSADQIGGRVADETKIQALYALLASMFFIVIYIWFRFQKVLFGLAAVLALVHDVLITVGFLGMSYFVAPFLGFLLVDPFKINLTIVAALLTIVGYSINDTIVVFDRIREVRGKSPYVTLAMLNQSINSTLSRTILTGLTTMFVVVVLYVFGGQGLHGFSFALMIGMITGTYSSVFIASPLLLLLAPKTAASGNSQAPPARQSVMA
jgi:SecD/SecF fusion protein